jgi:hypothetical protein
MKKRKKSAAYSVARRARIRSSFLLQYVKLKEIMISQKSRKPFLKNSEFFEVFNRYHAGNELEIRNTESETKKSFAYIPQKESLAVAR